MPMRNWSLVSLLCLSAPIAGAQQGRVAGPLAGYVFDGSSRAVRPVQGIPGASLMGDALDFGISVSSAGVSPRLDSAIVVAADGSLHIFSLNGGAAAEVAVNGIAMSPQRIAYSPTGSAAALYGNGKIQVVTGLPSAPKPGSSFDVAALLTVPGGRERAAMNGSMAVSDDGAYVLVSAGSGMHLLGAGGASQIASERGAMAAFSPGTHDAAIAGSRVTLIKDVGGTAAQQEIASGGSGVVGAAFSADGASLYVASAAARGVAIYHLADGSSTAIPCDCTPAGITAMGNVYRLNEAGSAPLWLLDTTATGPRIVFVPAKSSL